MRAAQAQKRRHMLKLLLFFLCAGILKNATAVDYTHGPAGRSVDAILEAYTIHNDFGYNHNTNTVTLSNGDVLMYWVCKPDNSGEAGQFCRAKYIKSE
ncbi:MAG: hypothetical protein GF401_20280 [Chitinivibrionales bacterium]|nr:hypothetical protein [Chitinivibrionales bacterium]